MSSHTQNIFPDVLWGLDRDAFEAPLHRSAIRVWRCDPNDPEINDIIQNRIHDLKMKKAFGQLVPFRKARLHHGHLVLTGWFGEQICVSHEWLKAGLWIVANTGAGKTML